MKIQLKRNQYSTTVEPGQLVAGEPVWFKDKLYIGSVGETAGGTSGASSGDMVFIGPDEWPVHMYRSVTGTAAVTSSPYYCSRWTVNDPNVTEYKDGMIVCIKVPVAGNGTYGTGFQINSLGYKPVVYNVNSMISTRYSVGSVVWAVYNSTQTGSLHLNSASASTVTGCWQVMDYDSNTNTIGYQLRTNSSTRPTSGATYRYRICFSSADDKKWVPANTSSSTNDTAAKSVNQTPIDPFGRVIYYGTTAYIASGNSLSATNQWQQYVLSLGYSFNRTGAALVLTYPAPVYVKCTPQTDGSAVIDPDEPYVQSLPTSDDGMIYMYLGQAYSATQIELTLEHPVYYHDGEGVRVWTGRPMPKKINDLSDVNVSSPEDGEVLAFNSTSNQWENMTIDGGAVL